MNQNKNEPGLAPEQQAAVDVMAAALLKTLSEQQPQKQQQQQPAAKTIDLVGLFFHLLSHLHLILIAAIVGAVLMGSQATKSVTIYSATSKLYVVGNTGSTLNISSLQLGNMLTMDYEEVFHTWEVHEMVRQELGLDYSYMQMQSMLTITNPEDTRVLYITVRNADPELAVNLANAYANAAKKFILQTMDGEEPNIFSVALTPSVASAPSRTNNTLMGFMLGAVLVIGILTLLFVLDERPRTPEDIDMAAGIPTLAVLPQADKKTLRQKLRGRHGR